MYQIAVVVALLFLVLLYLSRREDVTEGTGTLIKPFMKIAMYLYKKTCMYVPRAISSQVVETCLKGLHTGKSGNLLMTEYYVRKIALCLAVFAVGTFFGVAAKASAESKTILGRDGIVDRGDYLEAAQEVEICADYGGEQVKVLLEVAPRRLTSEETKMMFDELEKAIPQLILGENSDLQTVRDNLVLNDAYDGFPAVVEWKSNRPDVLNSAGRVKEVEVPAQVLLTFRMSYDDYQRESNMVVVVRPPLFSPEEELRRELERMLALSNETFAEEQEWQLPTEWKGEEISWSQIVEDNGLPIWFATIAVAVVLYFCSDRDLREKLEKRRDCMRQEYPEIVHKLVLFMEAGMTLRGSFRKLARDYEGRESKRRLPAYEEIVFACNELNSGVSEGMVYERLGKRTGVQEYIRLGMLMTQNLKRGSSTLLERLRAEADKASEEQLQRARKSGEEAGTKLLLPMVLQLAVVMVMIMVPVFLTM